MNRSRDRVAEVDGSLDRIFDALSHPMRRRVLVAVRERNPRQKREFAPGDRSNPGSTRREDVISLHHRHLPHLEEAGFVDWDREADTVTRGPAFEEIDPFLAWMDDHVDEHTGDRA